MFDALGSPVAAQVFHNADDSKLFTLVFSVELPPAGFTTYFVQKSPSARKFTFQSQTELIDDDTVIENDHVTLTFSGDEVL